MKKIIAKTQFEIETAIIIIICNFGQTMNIPPPPKKNISASVDKRKYSTKSSVSMEADEKLNLRPFFMS